MELIAVMRCDDELALRAKAHLRGLVTDICCFYPDSDVVTLDWSRTIALVGMKHANIPGRHTRIVQQRDRERGITIPKPFTCAKYVIVMRPWPYGDFAQAVKDRVAQCTFLYNCEQQERHFKKRA